MVPLDQSHKAWLVREGERKKLYASEEGEKERKLSKQKALRVKLINGIENNKKTVCIQPFR